MERLKWGRVAARDRRPRFAQQRFDFTMSSRQQPIHLRVRDILVESGRDRAKFFPVGSSFHGIMIAQAASLIVHGAR